MIRKLMPAALVPAALVLALTALPAAAVTCSGTGCTGQSPADTGCDADGVWVTASPVLVGNSAIGYVHLMFSSTCGTVWTRYSTYALQGTGSGYWSFLSNGALNFAYASGHTPVAASYGYTQVVDTDLAYHLDSLMYYRTESRVTSGVKSCGRVTGVVADKCTLLVDPDDL